MENKVTISIWEYEQLIRAQEQTRILKQLIKDTDYVSSGEVRAVLGIPEKPKIAAKTAEKVVQDG